MTWEKKRCHKSHFVFFKGSDLNASDALAAFHWKYSHIILQSCIALRTIRVTHVGSKTIVETWGHVWQPANNFLHQGGTLLLCGQDAAMRQERDSSW